MYITELSSVCFIPALDGWVRFLKFAERYHGSTVLEYREGRGG